MYTHKDLDKFKYLEKDDFMLDTLTGVLNRKNIIDYAKKLIDNNIPFSLGLIDIDDFKTINDNYGHQAGDIALIELSNGFIDYFKDNGLIGRYGGDEFIFIVEGDHDYKTIYDLTYNLYDNILRKMYTLGHITTFITATIGISRFPLNGNNYDELFLKCDKALYIGKMKGRNCFIIYLPEKHDNIDIGNRFKPLLSNQMKSISKTIEYDLPIDELISEAFDFVMKINSFPIMYYIDSKLDTLGYGIENFKVTINNEDIENLFGIEDYYTNSDVEVLKSINVKAYDFMREYGIQSLMITKVKYKNNFYGYLLIGENKILRIWQDDNISLSLFLSKEIAHIIYEEELKK